MTTKAISRFSMSPNETVLHDKLNKLVEEANQNFTNHAAAIAAANQTIALQAAAISALTARVAALEGAN